MNYLLMRMKKKNKWCPEVFWIVVLVPENHPCALVKGGQLCALLPWTLCCIVCGNIYQSQIKGSILHVLVAGISGHSLTNSVPLSSSDGTPCWVFTVCSHGRTAMFVWTCFWLKSWAHGCHLGEISYENKQKYSNLWPHFCRYYF